MEAPRKNGSNSKAFVSSCGMAIPGQVSLKKSLHNLSLLDMLGEEAELGDLQRSLLT